MQKIKNVEFLRIVLLFSIVMLHTFVSGCALGNKYPNIELYQYLKKCFVYGTQAVDAFFIMSGFFLFLTFKSDITFWDFIKKKYIRLVPAIIFSMILIFIGFLMHLWDFNIIHNVLTCLLFNHFGFYWFVSENRSLWFTSVLFFGYIFYFFILKFMTQNIRLWVFLTISVLGYIFLSVLTGGRFTNPYQIYYGILNTGVLRCILGLALGCLIGDIYKNKISKIINKVWNNKITISITLLEMCMLFFVFWELFCIHKFINHLFFIFTFAVLLFLFVIKKGYITQFFDSDIWVKFGKYQYSIYVVHYVLLRIICIFFLKNCPNFVEAYPILNVVLMEMSVILLGIFTYHFVEVPCADYLKGLLLTKSDKPIYERIFGGEGGGNVF